YDACGRATVKRTTPTGAPQYVVTTAYRADGRLAGITYPSGKAGSLTISYTYGKRGLLAAIPGAVKAAAYDLQGRRVSVDYANGVSTTYAYDAPGAISQLVHNGPAGVLRSTAFGRDGAGDLIAISSPDSALASTFTYDALHRLIQAAVGGTSFSYAYDDVGNLTSKSDVGAFKYGEAGAPATCLTTAGTDRFTYSALGQVEQALWGVQTFDAQGRLTAIAGTTSKSAFTYDYSGQRASASVTSGGSTTTRLTPDALYSVEDGVLVNNLFDGQRFFARDVDGAGRSYLHEDHVGSVVLVTDATGAVTDTIRYDPFGAVLGQSNSGAAPIGFAQGAYDAASGLLYLQSRYYHPKYGRFVSADAVVPSIYLPAAWNAYSYCANNPQTYADPSGHGLAWWQVLIAVVAVVALVVLTIVTCGVAAPALGATIAGITGMSVAAATASVYVAVGVGIVAGGIIGGLAASKAQGASAGDIILGALVGAAVGGWAALGATAASAAIASGIGGAVAGATGKFLADVVAGAAAGAINGAAMGFAAGFAGGKGTLDQTLADMALGALVGLVVGGVLGAAQYALTASVPTAPTTNPGQTPPGPALPQVGGVQSPPLGATGSVGSAAVTAGMPWVSYAGQLVARAIFLSPFVYGAEALITDTSVGILDLGYGPKILQWLEQNNISVTPGSTW
ncbi:MAG: RHS repeat-associated core domain-containing protein, partial [Candidatus Eremiobacteraeota bacterium]|nr:RHS repeat-associated core domain-containing protein [Candidatus Eremiobacteraeota bacterium]